jgi:dethiobiotin synthetase
MSKGLFIIGTDTNIGKTVVSAGLMYLLRKSGFNACYFKPILSGALAFNGGVIPLDTVFVKAVSSLDESSLNISPYIFRTPVSPHLAARLESRQIKVEKIDEKLEYLKSNYQYIIAEGCGGIGVPLNDDGYMLYDLIKHLGFSCVVVASASLGTINHTLLTVKFAESMGIKINGVIINNYTGLNFEDENIEAIKKYSGARILGIIPYIDDIDMEKLKYGNLTKVFEEKVNIGEILSAVEEIGVKLSEKIGSEIDVEIKMDIEKDSLEEIGESV